MTRLGAVLCFLLLALTACGRSDASAASSSDPSTAAPSLRSGAARYVALGDSYTAAPYVPLTDVANGCLRSDGNYPHLLAASRGYRLVDVSCGGATSADLKRPQHTFGRETVPPQLRAVTAGTKLVTLGIGGNDGGLFSSLSRGCHLTGSGANVYDTSGGNCGRVDLVRANASIARTQRLLVADLHAVRRRAPAAKVVLVGYPQIASSTRSCAKLPVGRSDAVAIDGVTRRLRDAMRSAARAEGAVFVDMYAASVDHDVCAGARAWVNGVHTDTQRAAALHPFAAEQRAVAHKIEKLLPLG